MASVATALNPVFKRRVFFVTDLEPEQLREKFRRFGVLDEFDQHFRLHRTHKDAEFIIFDLSHPPVGWAPYIGEDRRIEKGARIDVGNHVPFFFLTFDSEGEQSQASVPSRISQTVEQIRGNMEAVGIDVRPADPRRLVGDLRWFQSMMPFHKAEATRSRNIEDLIAIALANGKQKITESPE